MLESLNNKLRHFVDVYDGDVVSSMRIAGYTGADSYLKQKGNQLLEEPLIQIALRDRDMFKEKKRKAIADREERQALWTAIMRNEDPHHKEETDPVTNMPIPQTNIPLQTRLKASELLGKSEADFVDKIDMTVQHSLSDLIAQSYKVEQSIEDIEAEYYKIKGPEQLPTQLPTIEDLI